MIFAKFGCNWPSVSGKEDSKFYLLLLLHYYLPLEKGMVPHFNKLESPFSSMLCAMFDGNMPSGSREEYENKKSLLMTKGQ